MKNKLKQLLRELNTLLKHSECYIYSSYLDNAINGSNEEMWDFLLSNTLWGGAGSIADQALLENKEQRSKLEKTLINLGTMQINENKVNVRTDMWVSAFRKINHI